MTPSGMEGIVEGKQDVPNDQVMNEVMVGQQMGPADPAPPVSQVTTGVPLVTTQIAPASVAQAMTAGSSEQPTFQAAAAAPVIMLSAPASPLHVERAQLVDGSPTKSAEYSQPDWEIPAPNTSVINPRSDIPGIRAKLLREGNDADKLASLRLHREQLEALDPVLFDWDARVKAHLPLLQHALEAEKAKEITSIQRMQQLSAAQSKLPMGISHSDPRAGWPTKPVLKPRKRTSGRVKAAGPP